MHTSRALLRIVAHTNYESDSGLLQGAHQACATEPAVGNDDKLDAGRPLLCLHRFAGIGQPPVCLTIESRGSKDRVNTCLLSRLFGTDGGQQVGRLSRDRGCRRRRAMVWLCASLTSACGRSDPWPLSEDSRPGDGHRGDPSLGEEASTSDNVGGDPSPDDDPAVLPNTHLVLTRVVSEWSRVSVRQPAVPVSLRLENFSRSKIVLTEVTLELERDSQEVSAEYAVQAQSDNPTEIPVGAGASLRFLVDVLATAQAGTVTLGARATGVNAEGQRVAADQVRERDSWEVYVPDELVVTTTDDEDDTAGNPSLTSAGGPLDLSLREALLILRASPTPYAIRFDPGLFPAAQPALIILNAVLGSLPTLSVPFSSIDASERQA